MSSFLGTDQPFVGAPMAGGSSSPALVGAVAAAGGVGFMAGGYLTPEAFFARLEQMHSLGVVFGVNLFVPSQADIDEAAVTAYARRMVVEYRRYSLVPPEVDFAPDDDHWSEKIDALVRNPPSLVSVTFGLPLTADVERMKKAGMTVLMTVTSADEATAALAAGADGLVVQSTAAGGHSGVFDPASPRRPVELPELIPAVRRVAPLPVLAAGGLATAEAVRDAIAAGADGVVVGTALLRTDESGASAVHRDALVDPARIETVVTRAFTGRPARGLANAFTREYSQVAPLGYPVIHKLTAQLRATATARGDAERVHLWAGTGYRRARAAPVATVVEELTRLL